MDEVTGTISAEGLTSEKERNMDIERYQKHRCENCDNYDHCLKMCNVTGEIREYDDGYYCKFFEEG